MADTGGKKNPAGIVAIEFSVFSKKLKFSSLARNLEGVLPEPEQGAVAAGGGGGICESSKSKSRKRPKGDAARFVGAGNLSVSGPTHGGPEKRMKERERRT